MRVIEVIGEVTVDSGPGAAHRAWPSLERTAAGDLVVAYKVGPGTTGPTTGHLGGSPGLTRVRDGSLLLDSIRESALRHGLTQPRDSPCEKVYELSGGRLIETILAAWCWRASLRTTGATLGVTNRCISQVRFRRASERDRFAAWPPAGCWQ